MEVEKSMADLSGKNEALTVLLKKEKENTEYYLEEIKERFQERKLELERKMNQDAANWESKLEEADRWRKRLQEENDEFRSIIKLLKTQGMAGDKRSEQISFEMSRELSKLDANVAKDVSFISENAQVIRF